MPIHEDKVSFLRYEVALLTLKASLSTRDGNAPIYSAEYKEHQRSNFKQALRSELRDLESAYSNGRVAETTHCDYIESLSNRISSEFPQYLHNGCFRFGVAQKLVNLHLKYIWSLGLIEEPPHCPLDGIVRDIVGLNYDWTTNNSRYDYEQAISALKIQAAPRSLAVWELQEFRRREQSGA